MYAIFLHVIMSFLSSILMRKVPEIWKIVILDGAYGDFKINWTLLKLRTEAYFLTLRDFPTDFHH